ncbi:MAG: hypothetical protein KKA73_02260 [Chloroflexi bacterium]|nr:hypothetical protein [Chloroflexota bacterium]
MNLNDFIDRSQLGRVESFGGHQVHLQALIKGRYDHLVALLVIQGRPTDVRAVWARFHEDDLGYSFRRHRGKAYLQPNPVARLPQGDQEICIIHRGFIPGEVAADLDLTHHYTFGPPHFMALFQALFQIPALPHWEDRLWEMALEERLVWPVIGFNAQAWLVSNNPQKWMAAMADSLWRQHWTYEPAPEGNDE